jgi:drug/metabolite transporter (DMT)-like permease
VMWARFGFHLLIMATALRAWGGGGASRAPWRPRALRVQIIRSLALAVCNLLYALALQHVPLAECTAINFVGPVLTVALAAVWLRERVGWRRWVGLLAGLGGVMIVLRPGFGAVAPAGLFAFASAIVYAVYQILTRRLAGVDTAGTTILHTGLWATLATSLVLPFVWVWPSWQGWLLMALLGGLGGVGHYLLVLAYERAPASLIAPLSYAGMLFATLYGVLLFGETPDAATLLGAPVIAAGGLVVLSAETRRARAARPAAI